MELTAAQLRWSLGREHIAATIAVGGAVVVVLATRSPNEDGAVAPLLLAGVAQLEEAPNEALLELEPYYPPDEPVAEIDEVPPAPEVIEEIEPERIGAATLAEPITEPITEMAEPTTGGEAIPEAAPAIVTTPAASWYPHGRWVLFDRFGDPVYAIVQPWCVAWARECTEYGPVTPSCVWIEYLGQERVRAPFRLVDGAAEVCHDPTGLDRNRMSPLPADLAQALVRDAPYSLALVYE